MSPCGHLSIRIDEWPEDPFAWPLFDVPPEAPDAIHPAAYRSTAALKKIVESARSVPHARASMDDQLAEHDGPFARVRDDGAADSALLLSHQPEAGPPRCHPPHTHGAEHCHNYVVDECSDGSEKSAQLGPLHEGPGDLPTSFRSSGVRRGRGTSEDLRPLRSKVGFGPEERYDPGDAEGLSLGRDPAEPHEGDSGQAESGGKGQKARRTCRTTPSRTTSGTGALSRLFATVLHALASICAYKDSGNGGFLSSAEANAGTSQAQDPPAASWTWQSDPRSTVAWNGVHGVQRVRGEDECGSRAREPRGLDARGRMAPVARDGVRGQPGGIGARRALRPEQPHSGRGRLRERALSALRGSPDDPLQAEDRRVVSLKKGTCKRLLGNAKALREVWLSEMKVYELRTRRARSMRQYGVDVVEVYGGHAGITEAALQRGLRVLQPVDAIYDLKLHGPRDYNLLQELLLRYRPFLTIYEIPCTAWSRVQHLNYDHQELQQLRQRQQGAIEAMVKTILALHREGCHFLIENPAGTTFWDHPALRRLRSVPGAAMRTGHMCRFGLADKEGRLLKKPTAWLSDLPEVLNSVALECQCEPQQAHGRCLGGQVTRSAQVYTPRLCEAVVDGLQASLTAHGDERFCMSPAQGSEDDVAEVLFVDVNRHVDSWKPLLQEAEERLRGKAAMSAIVKAATPFFENIRTLVPWELMRVQISRTPMVRRLPIEVISAGAKHRGVVLHLSDDSIRIEAEAIKPILENSASRFASPVRTAIFFYGTAPDSSLDPTENLQPESKHVPSASRAKQTEELDSADALMPFQAGYRDITFPGLDRETPKWLLQALRRIHTNLGHPPKEALVRHLVHAGAHDNAVRAARHLQCEVCRRVAPPRAARPVKPFVPHRFNDRLSLDILFLKDIRGATYAYLNQVDSATSYQALAYLANRTEMEVLKVLVNGWFTFFGYPDQLLLDAEGAFKGYRFESLQAQCGVKLAYIPADAHHQLGHAERHGQAIRYVVRALVSQFAPTSTPEMNLVVSMATAAKNSLMRRSGSAPSQWVFGRLPRLPGALLSTGGTVEACQLLEDSERLRQIESVRAEAMAQYIRFEYDSTLRAALLRKGRPFRGPFEVGQRVAYYRARNQLDGQGTLEGYRQGVIVALDGPNGNIWVRTLRGRLVLCSREQCRVVPPHAEEEWWQPGQQDLDLLKNFEEDLPRHPLAFRAADGGAAPAADPLPADLPLDARGQPVLEPSPPLMLEPLMLVPPTPRTIPSTPRIAPATPGGGHGGPTPLTLPSVPEDKALVRESTDSAQDLPLVPEQSSATSAQDLALVPEQSSATSAQDLALVPEQSSASSSMLPTRGESVSRASRTLPTRGESVSRQTSNRDDSVSRQVTSERRSSGGLTSELERLIEAEYPDQRGTKRHASSTPEEVQLQDALLRSARPPFSDTAHRDDEQRVVGDGEGHIDIAQSFPVAWNSDLTFCRQCGEQHRVLRDEAPSCARCGCRQFVTNPADVLSWFDEVQERQAFDAILPAESDKQPLDDQGGPADAPHPLQAQAWKADVDHVSPTRRLDILRRHARGAQLQAGWDGTPHELQPFFENHAFLNTAHIYGDHEERPGVTKGLGDDRLVNFATSSTTSTSECLAANLLKQGVFDHDACQQLLDTVRLRPPSRSCHTDRTDSGNLVLGLFSHGNFSGITRDTVKHEQLTRYLTSYLKFHGICGPTTSVSVSHNVGALPHRDYHNAKDSMNYHLTLGEHTGGRLWVQADGAELTDPGGVVWRKINGKRVAGYYHDAFQQVLEFSPSDLHETEKFVGDRWSITAYTTRSIDTARLRDLHRLRQLGFSPVRHQGRKLRKWLEWSTFQAYPLTAAAESQEQIAMETSGDEGDDGGHVHEASRAKKQALKKELPWKAMTPEERPSFVAAVKAEWQEWLKWSSCHPVQMKPGAVDRSLILKSRLCYRWKPKAEEEGKYKAKARLVVAGFADPHLPLLTRDSPVLSRAGFMLLLQWSCSQKVALWNGDCRSAFLQGRPDDERPTPIFMAPPKDPIALEAIPEWNDSTLLYKLSAPVYGQSNAPRRWYLHVVDVMEGLNWTRHTLDPCLFLYRDNDTVVAVLGIHVDDVITAALDGYAKVLDEVHSKFEWGSPWVSRDFKFVGRRVKQREDGTITIDQEGYVAEVPLTKTKLEPSTPLQDYPDLVTEYRSGIGSLQWLAGTTRGDISADVSLIQKPPKDLLVSDLLEINAVLRYVRATQDSFVRLHPVNLTNLLFICYGDSGWGNAYGGKSQGGLLVVATDDSVYTEPRPGSILEWKSYRHQRVLRSTLAAEACALDRAQDYGNYLALMFSEMTDGQFLATHNARPAYPVIPVTDSRSVWDSVHRMSTTFAEKRVEVDIAGLRESCRGLRWVPTEQQKADCLTKRSKTLRDEFRKFLANPLVTLTEARSAEDMLTGQANAKWR